MKIRFQYIIAFLSILSFIGCEKSPTLFKEADGVYFGTKTSDTAYSFAKYPKKIADTIRIPVKVLGNSFGADRPIEFEIVASTDPNAAIEGTHFKMLNNNVVAANSYNGVIPVAVYRTADLEAGGSVKFTIRLKQNKDFPSEGITSKKEVTVNLAYIQQPANWGTYPNGTLFAGNQSNFGTWTPAKYKLILEALYNPETGETVTEFPGFSGFSATIQNNQYVAIVRNYIKANYPGNYTGTGAKLIDPATNLPIQVGPANY